jgi:hypothetical protein
MIIPTMESIPRADMEIPKKAKPGPMGAQRRYDAKAALAIPAIAGKTLKNP